MQAPHTLGPSTHPTETPGPGDPPTPTNTLLPSHTPIFHDLVTGQGVGDNHHGHHHGPATQALVARWDPDTGQKTGRAGRKSCTHRSRPRPRGPFPRFHETPPPSKDAPCGAWGASPDPPRPQAPGGCSSSAATTKGGSRAGVQGTGGRLAPGQVVILGLSAAGTCGTIPRLHFGGGNGLGWGGWVGGEGAGNAMPHGTRAPHAPLTIVITSYMDT
jgi:hypothetical protein